MTFRVRARQTVVQRLDDVDPWTAALSALPLGAGA
jgi:hypothetical protein